MRAIIEFLLSCILFLQFVSCTNANKQENIGMQNAQAIKNYQQQVDKRVAELEKTNANVTLKDQGAYWGNDSLNLISLSELAKGHKLFFYFSYNTCPPCVQECVNMLERYMPDYLKNENIVFLSPDYLPRFRDNCYGKRLLGLKNEELGIPLEKEEIPFFFTLDENLSMHNLHVVNKNDFKKTGDYLKKMKN